MLYTMCLYQQINEKIPISKCLKYCSNPQWSNSIRNVGANVKPLLMFLPLTYFNRNEIKLTLQNINKLTNTSWFCVRSEGAELVDVLVFVYNLYPQTLSFWHNKEFFALPYIFLGTFWHLVGLTLLPISLL